MKKTILFIMLLIFSLTACAGGGSSPEQTPTSAATSEVVVQPSPTSLPTEDPPVQVDPPATQALTVTQSTAQDPEPTATQEPERVLSFGIVPGESSVSYEVNEVFIREGNVLNTAIGVTDVVSGVIHIDYNNPQNSIIGPISVDISKLTSDQNLRDKAIRERWLESEKFPIATFVSTKIEGIPEVGDEGKDYALRITGDMTIREVTKEVTFDATVKVDGDVMSGTAMTTLLMSDFEVGPINIIGILKTDDEVKLTFNLVAKTDASQ
jgi:polyisoprenoid-binding protein YceI